MTPRDMNDHRRYHFALDSMILNSGEGVKRK